MRLQVAAGGPAALKVVAAAEFAAAPVRLCWTPPAGQAFAGRVWGGTGSTGTGGPGAPGGLPRAPPTPHGPSPPLRAAPVAAVLAVGALPAAGQRRRPLLPQRHLPVSTGGAAGHREGTGDGAAALPLPSSPPPAGICSWPAGRSRPTSPTSGWNGRPRSCRWVAGALWWGRARGLACLTPPCPVPPSAPSSRWWRRPCTRSWCMARRGWRRRGTWESCWLTSSRACPGEALPTLLG